MKIRLIGQKNDSGIGTHFGYFSEALLEIYGINGLVELVDFADAEAMDRAVKATTDQDITISFVGGNLKPWIRGRFVIWSVFETTKIPDQLRAGLAGADDIWVPSTWCRQVLIDNAYPAAQCHVVPEGVDGKLFHAYLRPQYTPDQVFRFLCVGKYERRKGYPEVLQAWADTFNNDATAELIIKTDWFDAPEQRHQQVQEDIRRLGLTNVRLLWGKTHYHDVVRLYRQCQVFVSPSRGEAWGLPMIEAVASGMPLVATVYSGHRDFLQPAMTSVIAVDYSLAPVRCPDFERFYTAADGDLGQWADPSVASLTAGLLTARKEFESLNRHAQINSARIREHFSWANSANRAVERLIQTRAFG